MPDLVDPNWYEYHYPEEYDGTRECDQCGRVTDAGEWPDWINGKCEQCDLSVLTDPDNVARVSPEQLGVALQEVIHFHSRRN